MTEYDLSPHTGRDLSGIAFWEHDGSLLVTRSGEGYVTLDAVVGETRNPRTLVTQADRAIVEGQLVTVYYNAALKTVEGQHPMAGKVVRVAVDEMMDEPALLLERVHGPKQEDTA
jgi:hypothetical protein